MAFNDNAMNMDVQEAMIAYVVRALHRTSTGRSSKCSSATCRASKQFARRFRRIDYSDAVATLQNKGSAIKWGDDLGAEDESLLVADYDDAGVRGELSEGGESVLHEGESGRSTHGALRGLLAPEGYGEIIGGSQREDDYDRLVAAHPGRRSADRRVRLVSRPAQVRHVRALGLRARPRANGRMDLRSAAHPRGDRVSPNDVHGSGRSSARADPRALDRTFGALTSSQIASSCSSDAAAEFTSALARDRSMPRTRR